MQTKSQSADRGVVEIIRRDAATGRLIERIVTTNTITQPVHEHIATLLDPDAADSDRAPITHLAIGDSDAARSYSDTQLANEHSRIAISDYVKQTNDSFVSTFIAATDLVGQDIVEGGLTTGDGSEAVYNSFVLAAGEQITGKSSQETLTINATLQWRSA